MERISWAAYKKLN